jgi:hypothetical protein
LSSRNNDILKKNNDILGRGDRGREGALSSRDCGFRPLIILIFIGGDASAAAGIDGLDQ